MSASLRVVSAQSLVVTQPTAVAQDISRRVQDLQTQARSLAREHMAALETALAQVAVMSGDIARGGEAYPPGVRDLARRLSEDATTRFRTLEAIRART